MRFFNVLFLLFLLFTPTVFWGQSYHFRNYTVKDGIAQSQVYALLQDSRGYLWMGTRGGGLTRFDGITFTTFTEKNGLGNNYINCIREDPEGNLWIGTNNGISRYNGLTFESFKFSDSEGKFQILSIVWDTKGKMFLSGNKGVFTFDGKQFKSLNEQLELENLTVNTLLFDKEDRLYVGYSKGLFRYTLNNNRWKKQNFGDENRYMRNAITTLTEDKAGHLWIGTYGDGMYCYNGNQFFRIDLKHELYKQTVLDIYIDHNQDLWIGTLTSGVAHYSKAGKSFSWFGEREGLSNNHVRSICQDNSNSYWFGTSGGGVANYAGNQFTGYDEKSGLKTNFIYSVFRDSKNRLWIGNGQKGVTLKENNTFVIFDGLNGFADVKVKAMAEDFQGNLYFGTDGQGVFRYDGETFEGLKEFSRSYIRSIQVDNQGNLWVATAGLGILKWNGELQKRFLVADGLLQNRITCLHIDKMNRIWYGSEENGIGYIFNDVPSKNYIQEKNGLSSNAIRCLSEDANGTIWAGTAGAGINRISFNGNKHQIRIYGIKDGLTSSNVYLISNDDSGNCIVGTETGIDFIEFQTDNTVKDIRHFGKSEGFTGIETCQNASFKDNDGTFWFGTINGLFHYNPANLYRNNHEPITQIRDIKLFYIPLSQTNYKDKIKPWNKIEQLLLPHDQNHISFDFFAINFSNPEAVRYQWKLVGFDENWSPPSKEHSIVYSNLNPGKYTFLLKASNEDEVWNKQPIAFSFEIELPFWKTWWFLTLEIGLIGLILFLLFRWRINLVRNKSREREEKISMEKELMELEQKALRLQMNPHFIFNALNSIQSQIGTGNEQEARYYLAKFSRLMRQILSNSRNTFITLEEEVSTLENYLLIEKFCNGDRFDYTIQVDESLEKDFILIPPMLLQPFVENAIKHGFKFPPNEPRNGQIKVTFRSVEEHLICEVKDNGIGRKKAAENNAKSMESYHESTALKVTNERLELLKKENTTAQLEIIDLYTDEQEAFGTLVRLTIPIMH